MALDLTGLITQIEALQEEIRFRRDALRNDRGYPDLTDEQRIPLDALIDVHSQWQTVATDLALAAKDLHDLGYPTLPRGIAPAAMIAKYIEESKEAVFGPTLFDPEPTAARLGAPLFGAPKPKEE